MKLTDGEALFEFEVLGYEYPVVDNVYDANWLVLRVQANDGAEKWEASCACIRTFELVELRNWFSLLPSMHSSSITFTENELSFRYDAQARLLDVVLDFRLHPKGGQYDYIRDRECVIQFRWDAISTVAIMNCLNKLIIQYPERRVS